MASSSKLRGGQDRISGLPDALLCRILSLLYNTREAVKTSVLSHRWKNVWASVANIDLDQNEMEVAYRGAKKPCVPKDFTEFVDRVLLFRGGADIHRFRLTATNSGIEDSRIGAWINSAIKHNVVELDLAVVSSQHYEIPRGIFMCNTLVSLKLRLGRNTSANTPSSKMFPYLKRLHVTVGYPSSDSMEKLFSCCPALEALVIDGSVDDTSSYNLCITALKLKRLKIAFKVMKFAERSTDDLENSVCRIFINADVPNLEELEICSDFTVSYSLKNVKCLRKAEIKLFDNEELGDIYCIPGRCDRIRKLVVGIFNAKCLTVLCPKLVATYNSLKHLELQLNQCCSMHSLIAYLRLSPILEHLKISASGRFQTVDKYCDDGMEEGILCTCNGPPHVPVSLSLHLKTISLWGFNGCPNELAVIKYLVQHGKALNEVTIHTRFSESIKLRRQSRIGLWLECLEFPRGSKNCEIVLRDH